MLRDRSIVCISAIDWDFIWQSHQEIMRRLAAAGNEILYVENLGVRTPGLRDAGRVLRRLGKWLRGGRTAAVREIGVRVHSPLILPLPYSRTARRVNRSILARTVVPMAAQLRERPIVWTFLPTPSALDLAEMLRPALLIYHCVDDLQASSRAAARIGESEHALIERADLVIATSRALESHCREVRTDVHRISAGVDVDRFRGHPPEPRDIAALPHPRVVYVGGIHRWIDFALLRAAVSALPDIHFVLVGPLQTDPRGLAAPNVHLVGQRPHAALPGYIGACDAAIIPYARDRYVDSVYPSKLNEYLAMGLPVVATPIPELVQHERDWPGTVVFGADAVSFADALRNAILDHGHEAVRRRVAAASSNAWERKVELMSALVEDALAKKAAGP